MPVFSFNERFVPMVEDGSKRQTVRAFRSYIVRKGQLAYLYCGMRTKWCRKLVDPNPEIKDVKVIAIYPSGKMILVDTNYLLPFDCALLKVEKLDVKNHSKILTEAEKNQFAWDDGFRAEDGNHFDLFIKYWNQTHALPFVGFVTYW